MRSDRDWHSQAVVTFLFQYIKCAILTPTQLWIIVCSQIKVARNNMKTFNQKAFEMCIWAQTLLLYRIHVSENKTVSETYILNL